MKKFQFKILPGVLIIVGLFTYASASIVPFDSCGTPFPMSPNYEYPVGHGKAECPFPTLFDCCIRFEGSMQVLYKRTTPEPRS